jgi:hypothetical protein
MGISRVSPAEMVIMGISRVSRQPKRSAEKADEIFQPSTVVFAKPAGQRITPPEKQIQTIIGSGIVVALV